MSLVQARKGRPGRSILQLVKLWRTTTFFLNKSKTLPQSKLSPLNMSALILLSLPPLAFLPFQTNSEGHNSLNSPWAPPRLGLSPPPHVPLLPASGHLGPLGQSSRVVPRPGAQCHPLSAWMQAPEERLRPVSSQDCSFTLQPTPSPNVPRVPSATLAREDSILEPDKGDGLMWKYLTVHFKIYVAWILPQVKKNLLRMKVQAELYQKCKVSWCSLPTYLKNIKVTYDITMAG